MKSDGIRIGGLSVATVGLVALGLSASGCETTKGVGRDVQDVGQTVEEGVEGEDADPGRIERRNPPPPGAR